MKRYLAILAVLALASCTIIQAPAPGPAAPPTEEPTSPPSPVWSPGPRHVYVLDAERAIIYDYAATEADNYKWAVTAYGLDTDLHNVQYPDASLAPRGRRA